MLNAIFIYSTLFPEAMGSVQLQAFIPARHLGAKALYFGPGHNADAFLDRHRPNALIFTKLFDPHVVTLALNAKERGVKVISVFCDLHFTDGIGESNRRISELADIIVAPTQYLADAATKHFGRPIIVIEEPYRFPRHPVQFSPGSILKIVWYGHHNNNDTLPAGVANLSRYRDRQISLMIICNVPPNIKELAKTAGPIKLSYLPWSPAMQVEMVQISDMVFLPSLDTEDKRTKGHDRLVEAINAGRLAIAHPLPQYLELSAYCKCGEDYAASIQAALGNPEATRQKLMEGQHYIDSRFAPEVVADKWRGVIETTSVLSQTFES